ncbi:MAG TPA: SCO family protein [bacterium]|nr:SCO family protein [bacterium]
MVLLAAVLVVAAAGGLLWTAWNVTRPRGLTGGVFASPTAAPDFRLADQDGHPVSLSGLRGKVVVLTFLYTHCPDACPLIADALHRAYGQLGSTSARTAFLAVSVDPNGDTPQAIHQFLDEHHVQGELMYLHGTLAQLRPVWAHYYVGSDANKVNPAAVATAAPAPGQINHTAIVYVIDPRGRLRAFLAGDTLDPQTLVTDVKALAP